MSTTPAPDQRPPSMAQLRDFLGPQIADLLSDELIEQAYRHAQALLAFEAGLSRDAATGRRH